MSFSSLELAAPARLPDAYGMGALYSKLADATLYLFSSPASGRERCENRE
jgi:hypothetical protein